MTEQNTQGIIKAENLPLRERQKADIWNIWQNSTKEEFEIRVCDIVSYCKIQQVSPQKAIDFLIGKLQEYRYYLKACGNKNYEGDGYYITGVLEAILFFILTDLSEEYSRNEHKEIPEAVKKNLKNKTKTEESALIEAVKKHGFFIRKISVEIPKQEIEALKDLNLSDYVITGEPKPTPQPEEQIDKDFEAYFESKQGEKDYIAYAAFDIIFEALGVSNCDEAVKSKAINLLMGGRVDVKTTARGRRRWKGDAEGDVPKEQKEALKRIAEKRLKTLKNELVNRIIDK